MAKTVWKRFVLILFSMLMSLSVFDIPRVEAASAPSSNSQYWYGATVMKTQQVTATSEVKITKSATLMKGGASLYPYWTPSSTCIGKDSYSIAVGFGASASYSATGWAGSISGSASGSISFDKDYLTVTDNTNISTQKCGAKFDYIKSHLGYCASGRRKVVMGQTKQYIEYFWTTSDNSYNQTLNLACYFSVVDSKSWPNTLKTFSVSIPLVSKY